MNARAFFLALLLVAGAASALVPVPPLSARVTDLTGTLTVSQRSALESKLAAFEREKGSQIAVLLVPTTQPETIEQFGIRVAEAWKIGRERVDDGAILIVAVNDRALRIEVGYGLEGAVPDAIANRIIEEIIVPRFRGGDFAGGIESGVDQLVRVIGGEPLPPPRARPSGRIEGPSIENLWLILFIPMIVGTAIRRLHNRVSGGLAAAGTAGLLGWWWTSQLMIGAVFGLVCGVLILAASGGGRGGRWSSGGWGGGYSGGGGFGGGGWSGGGGGFGGGGASGRW